MNPKPKNNEKTKMTEFKVNFADFIKELEYHKRNRTPELYINVEVFEAPEVDHVLTMVARLSLLSERGLTEAINLSTARVSPDATPGFYGRRVFAFRDEKDVALIDSFKIKNDSGKEFESVESALENAFAGFKAQNSYKEKIQ